jgi:hypothetical protein
MKSDDFDYYDSFVRNDLLEIKKILNQNSEQGCKLLDHFLDKFGCMEAKLKGISSLKLICSRLQKLKQTYCY